MSTVTARIPEDLATKLDALAKATNRSKSFLVASALEEFLNTQGWQVERINESIAQADGGHFATDAQVKEAFGKWGFDIDAQ